MNRDRQTTTITGWFEKGLAAQDSGLTKVAIEAYQKAIEFDPRNFAATYNLATIYHDLNQLEPARQAYIEALKLNPSLAPALKGLGDLLFSLKEIEPALSLYKQALVIDPKLAPVWHNIGHIEQFRHNLSEALDAYRKAIKLQPDYKSALASLTKLSLKTGAIDETISFLGDLDNNFPQNNYLKTALAEIFYNHHEPEKALHHIHAALNVDKQNGEAFNLLGLILMRRGEVSTARFNFKKACDLEPNSLKINSNLLYSYLTDPATTPKDYLKETRMWWRRHGAPLAAKTVFNHLCPLSDNRPLRLGFISADFQYHSVSFFFLPLIRALSKIPGNKFTIYCYSDSLTEDEYTCKIKKNTDQWHSIYGLDDGVVAEMIVADKIDILVELSGHTSNNRLPVIARQPAPVQFSWLGYPASTGIENNTYRLSDNICDPEEFQAHYSETLTYIKPPFLNYEPPPETKKLAISKKGAPAGKVIFASFNNAAKINHKVIDTWAKILQRLPGSTLLLKTRTLKSKSATVFCKNRFAEQGIAPERIVVDSNNYPTVKHFESYNRIDIALDPFPYNGTTTTCDALWMGVPVITLKGKTHAARVGTSLLTSIGCPELVAENETEYIEKAIILAKDPARLTGYHTKIRSLIQNSPLMDASGFAHNFSKAISSRWQEWRIQQLSIFKKLIKENDNTLALPPGFTELLPTNPAAITLLYKAIESNRNLHLFVKLGQKYAKEERLEEACICYRKAVAEDGNNAIYRYVLANTLQQLEHDDEALHHYCKALAQDPKQSNAASGLSSILRKHNESETALEILLNAQKLNPENNTINFELANVYYDLHRLEEAYDSLCNCLKFEPKQSGIWNNIGYLMAESGKIDKATECYRKALSINPDLIESRTNLIWLMAQNCSWQERDKLLKKCHFLPPLTSVILENNPQHNLICAQNVVEKLKKEALVMPHQTNKKLKENDLIRIGYLSCDFRDHPVAHNILNLFRLHDRKHFHITAYSCGPSDNSSYRQQISKDCDHFVDLKKLNDRNGAKRIHADKIDILIELMGHTRENRLGILAYRPAPIQVSYLGYPGTTGADFINYIIADRIVIPPEHRIHYSEEVIYLNNCFMIADRAPIGPSPKRSDFNLPEKGFLFCSFNSPFKIEPVMFKVWMDIMTVIPNSYLWLREASERYKANLKNESKKHGVDPIRLIFAPRTAKKGDHLARLGLADLALDTRIYNGHTTTLDALWAGVPVLTCKGRHFASLVSDSNLKSIGLEEMSVPDLKTYRETAINLAKNPEKLKIIRQKLADNRLTTPLFDTEKSVRNLEEVYLKIWQKTKNN